MNTPDHRHRVAAERRERMRGRLLSSALSLVARQGPAATSIDDVISAAQVSRGTFYKYFESPDDLVRALALDVVNELIRMAEPVVLGYSDPAERVATGMRLVSRLALDRPVVAGFIVRLGWPELDDRPVLLDFVRRDLEDGLARGRFTPMPIELALDIVSATVLGAIHRMLRPGCAADFAEQATASALRALGLPAKEARRISALKIAASPPAAGGLVDTSTS
jgi:AcrR family transcriptional regulator